MVWFFYCILCLILFIFFSFDCLPVLLVCYFFPDELFLIFIFFISFPCRQSGTVHRGQGKMSLGRLKTLNKGTRAPFGIGAVRLGRRPFAWMGRGVGHWTERGFQTVAQINLPDNSPGDNGDAYNLRWFESVI